MTLLPKVTSKRVINFFKTLEDRFIEIHGDKYSYDKAVYINSATKLTITCPIHGDFQMSANKHLAGQNCTKCSNRIGDTKEFIRRANLRHNNYYTYEKAEYKSSKEPIVITCPIHGDFEQKAYRHLYGDGCKKCVQEKLIEPVGSRRKYTPNQHNLVNNTERFIKAAKEAHGNTYSYDKSVFVDSYTKLTITCHAHGDFEQLPRNHFYLKQGCSTCKRAGYDNTKKHGWLYIYKITSDVIGYGITTQPYVRHTTHMEMFKEHKINNVELLHLYKSDAKTIEQVEKVLKQQFSKEKINLPGFITENTNILNLNSMLKVIRRKCTKATFFKEKLNRI